MDLPDLNRKNTGIPSAPPPRILQFGGGNFLRAFVDWMVAVMNEKTGYNGGVIIVKPTPGGSYEALEKQEGLFHVGLRGMENGAVSESYRLVTCIAGSVNPYADFHAFLQTAALPGIDLIVSNTTEAGIVYRPEDRLADAPAAGFPGKLTQWLYHRYRHFNGDPGRGVTVLPCELIEQNGRELGRIVRQLAAAWNLETGFLNWLDRSNAFCNTLVDRIVTGAPEPAEAPALEARTGFRDRQLVLAEPYHLWVIEGNEQVQSKFPTPAAGLNVRFVDDLTPYRTLKVRILNGAHTAMTPLGLLNGLPTVREVIEDATYGKFIRELITEEIIPALDHAAGEALAYADATIERFRNPFLRHRLADIALNTTSKFAARLLPSFEAYFQKFHRPPERLTVALAALIRFYGGPWQGRKLPVRDEPQAIAHFQDAWQSDSLKVVAQKALAYWSFSNSLRPALEERIAATLEQWSFKVGGVQK